MQRVIWQNVDLKPFDWKDCIEEDLPEDANEDAIMDHITELNNEYLDDERENLKIDLGVPMVMFGTVERWNGTSTGAKIVGYDGDTSFPDSAYLSDALSFDKDCDTAQWYVEDGELQSDQWHHDGHNHFTYRALTAEGYRMWDKVEEGLYASQEETIAKYTRSLAADVSQVFGWEDTAESMTADWITDYGRFETTSGAYFMSFKDVQNNLLTSWQDEDIGERLAKRIAEHFDPNVVLEYEITDEGFDLTFALDYCPQVDQEEFDDFLEGREE